MGPLTMHKFRWTNPKDSDDFKIIYLFGDMHTDEVNCPKDKKYPRFNQMLLEHLRKTDKIVDFFVEDTHEKKTPPKKLREISPILDVSTSIWGEREWKEGMTGLDTTEGEILYNVRIHSSDPRNDTETGKIDFLGKYWLVPFLLAFHNAVSSYDIYYSKNIDYEFIETLSVLFTSLMKRDLELNIPSSTRKEIAEEIKDAIKEIDEEIKDSTEQIKQDEKYLDEMKGYIENPDMDRKDLYPFDSDEDITESIERTKMDIINLTKHIKIKSKERKKVPDIVGEETIENFMENNLPLSRIWKQITNIPYKNIKKSLFNYLERIAYRFVILPRFGIGGIKNLPDIQRQFQAGILKKEDVAHYFRSRTGKRKDYSETDEIIDEIVDGLKYIGEDILETYFLGRCFRTFKNTKEDFPIYAPKYIIGYFGSYHIQKISDILKDKPFFAVEEKFVEEGKWTQCIDLGIDEPMF
jgi:hypothetical protein